MTVLGRRRTEWAWALTALLLLLAPLPAGAHTKSETNANWQVLASGARVVLTIPELEARRLSADGQAQPSDPVLAGYLQAHVGALRQGVSCKAAPPTLLQAQAGYRRVEMVFSCPGAPDALQFDGFFERVPTHVNFAQIELPSGEFVEEVFRKDRTRVDVGPGAGSRLQGAPFYEYVLLGVEHIFTGLDHQCFLLGMVMLCRRLRDLLFVVTGFTIGHSATLALAVTGLLRPRAEYIDALVALTIVLIGVENVAVATRRPAIFAAGLAAMLLGLAGLHVAGLPGLPVLLSAGGAIFAANYLMISGSLTDAGRLRLVVTLIFGLIHGFGFAAGLLEMRLPKTRLAELLVGFNLGVEIAQLTVVLGVTGLALLLVRLKLAPSRGLTVDVGSAFLIAIGLYWFLSRTFELPAAGLGG